MRLHHVQLSCPPGGEDAARAFWIDGVGLSEAAKPPVLAARGGAWFRAHDGERVTLEVHVGVEADGVPARRAHPAILLDSVAELDRTVRRLAALPAGLGVDIVTDERDTLPGFARVHVFDPHGNRVELLAAV